MPLLDLFAIEHGDRGADFRLGHLAPPDAESVAERLLEFCRGLGEEQLKGSTPGAYGSVLSTLRHVLGAEAMYRSILSGILPQWDWRGEELPAVAEMEGWAKEMAAYWQELLTQPIDPQKALVWKLRDGTERNTRAGIVLSQALHHGTAHREQICTILTTMGIEPPDLSVWAYGAQNG